MDSSAFQQIFQHLQATGFADIAGTRVFATIPIAEALLNRVIRDTMPPDLPVRDVSVRPLDGNRLSVRVTPRAMFIPAITLDLNIEKQPDIPTSPVLVLRLATMPGILGLAGAAMPIDRMLPPGVRLQGEVITVDVQELARHHGFEQLFARLRQLRLTTDHGRVLLTVEAGVS